MSSLTAQSCPQVRISEYQHFWRTSAPDWISSSLLTHPELLLEGMGFPGTLDASNTLPRWLLRERWPHTVPLKVPLWQGRTALELCRGTQSSVISHSWELLPPLLLRYSKEIRFFLNIQGGYKLQLRRKGLPQEIVSNIKAAQQQFICFSLPSGTAHNLYFCDLFSLECRTMTSHR